MSWNAINICPRNSPDRLPNLLRENWLRSWKIPILARFGHCRLKLKKSPKQATLKLLIIKRLMAEPTGLESATSNVTVWRSNQLNYDSAFGFWILDFRFWI